MLVTTRAKVEDEADLSETERSERAEKKDWVAFVLEAREIMPFDLDQLSRFVVKSISFTTNVQSISLIVNDTKLLQVHTNGTKGTYNLEYSAVLVSPFTQITVSLQKRR